ncbi:MAG: DeoR/GlpR transcriptional regulator, partial [Spirochaetales bacterium]|nr:DeoR/GlpR transcriptional regulator [Spirochaetales bacterium]
MIHLPRHGEILRLLNLLHTVSVSDLSQRLGVSEVTIRKDLSQLEDMGCLVRTHGGALIAEDTRVLRTVDVRQHENLEEKRTIARKALELMREGETIYLDAGSTCLMLARELRTSSVRVVTNSLDIMVELGSAPEVSLICLGGSFRREAASFVGPMALEALSMLHIGTCFMGTSGFSSQAVFSSQNLIEAQLKQKVLGASRRRVVLADAAKYGKEA